MDIPKLCSETGTLLNALKSEECSRVDSKNESFLVRAYKVGDIIRIDVLPLPRPNQRA